jgi:hypothetical protein
MYGYILMLVLSTGPHTILFEKFEDCASSGNGFIDTYKELDIKAVCMRTIAI